MADKQEVNVDEYDEFDFGFSTVDEEEVKEFETKVQSKVAVFQMILKLRSISC